MGVAVHVGTRADPLAIAAGGTRYWANAGDLTTEAYRQIDWAVAGTFSNLRVRVTVNAATASSSVTLRKNGADTALTLTVGAGQTGVFEDATNSVSVVAGDDVHNQIIVGTGGDISVDLVASLFTNTDGVFCFQQTCAAVSLTVASQTAYMVINGRLASGQTGESNQQELIRSSIVASRFQMHVSANARTTNTTFRTRVNTANGAQSVVVGSGQTGRFVDTTNTDTLVDSDLYCFQYVTGTGTQTLTVHMLAVGFQTATNWQELIVGNAAGLPYTNNDETIFLKPVGDLGFTTPVTDETNRKMALDKITAVSNLRIRLNANARAVTQTCTLRKNGADTSQTVSIGASQTGTFEDTSTVTDVDVADEIAIAVATGVSASSATIKWAGLTMRDVGLPPNSRNRRRRRHHRRPGRNQSMAV